VDQFKSEILLLQRQIEKEDIGAVIFNDQDSGRGSHRGGFQSLLPIALHHIQLTSSALAVTLAAPLRTAAGRSSKSALYGKRWLR
jgi:hypothetical protein